MAFEEELKTLIERTKKNGTDTSYKESYEAINSNFYDVKKQHEIWMNDVEIFFNKYLKEHVLAPKIESWLFHRKYNQLVAALESICNDKNYIDKMNGISTVEVPKYQANSLPEYDVFISHANKDKENLIEELYKSLKKLVLKYFMIKKNLNGEIIGRTESLMELRKLNLQLL